jgi:hypothetical protein
MTKWTTKLTIAKIITKSAGCKYENCWSCGEWQEKDIWKKAGEIGHGDVSLLLSDKKTIVLPTKGMVRFVREAEKEDGASAYTPQLSPDKTLVGVTMGKHQQCDDWSVGGTMFVNSELHFYDAQGKRVSVCKVPGTFIDRWQYFQKEKQLQVVIASRWHHGATTYRVFDLKTGRERGKHMGMWASKKTMPAWLKEIYEEI